MAKDALDNVAIGDKSRRVTLQAPWMNLPRVWITEQLLDVVSCEIDSRVDLGSEKAELPRQACWV